ncbi:MAG: AAA family ATPase, partial [Mycobacterium sp.]|nr:AAA family ATPase [Mycobacterium sp.]
MPSPLLETKLFIPTRRGAHLARPRLAQQLNRVYEAKLTLVSAPPGFGKTTLLATWLADAPENRPSIAWLSLDQADNAPTVFWKYVIATLNRRLAAGVGGSALALLELDPAPIDAVLTALLNDVAADPNELVLVLDDYHVIEERDIHDGMAFLLDHLPPQFHVVIASRA